MSESRSVWVERRSGMTYTTDIRVRDHELIADEPLDKNGADLGPTPVELLLASVGACAAITIEYYANMKGWPLESVAVEVTREPDPASETKTDLIRQRISLAGPLTEEQRARLLLVAGRCPVHRLLERSPRIIDELVTATA